MTVYYKPVSIANDLIDPTTGSDSVAYSPSLPGHISIKGSSVRVTTAIVNTTTPAVISLKNGSTVLGTVTLTDGLAVGKEVHFTPASDYESQKDVYFAADASLTMETTTAGLGGTPAGAVEGTFAVALAE